MFMNQLILLESEQINAFGFFNINFNLVISVSIDSELYLLIEFI